MEPAPAHVLAERRHGQLLRDLRLAYERAAAAATDEVAVSDAVVEGGAERQPRHAELDGELPLGGDRLAHAEAFDELEDALSRLGLLRDPLGRGHRRSSSQGGGRSPQPSPVAESGQDQSVVFRRKRYYTRRVASPPSTERRRTEGADLDL